MEFLYSIKELCIFSNRIYIFFFSIESIYIVRKKLLNVALIRRNKLHSPQKNLQYLYYGYKLDVDREIIKPRNFSIAYQDINIDYNITSFLISITAQIPPTHNSNGCRELEKLLSPDTQLHKIETTNDNTRFTSLWHTFHIWNIRAWSQWKTALSTSKSCWY